jgi:hypothetical protein
MSFEVVRRRGKYWDDAKTMDSIIGDFPFNTTGRNERDFENGFATTLLAMKSSFNSEVIAQIDKSKTVTSVYCFGKNHRPDITIGESGIAVELKFISYDGLTNAIGQGYVYRLSYKFVFMILIISENRKFIYADLDSHAEKGLEDTLQHLADNMNIFTYVVPAFNIRPGERKCISFFDKKA